MSSAAPSSPNPSKPLLPQSTTQSRYWLLRAPTWLIKEWETLSKQSSHKMLPLAQIQIPKNLDYTQPLTIETVTSLTLPQIKRSEILLSYTPQCESNKSQPHEYVFRSKPLKPMLLFNELQGNDLGTHCKLLGAINEIADLATAPTQQSFYINSIQQKLKKTMQVQKLEAAQSMNLTGTNIRVAMAKTEKEAEKIIEAERKRKYEERRQKVERRYREDEPRVIDRIHDTFEEQYESFVERAKRQKTEEMQDVSETKEIVPAGAYFLTLRQLDEKLADQPKEYIREILQKICLRQSGGEFNNYYRLKPEIAKHPYTDEAMELHQKEKALKNSVIADETNETFEIELMDK